MRQIDPIEALLGRRAPSPRFRFNPEGDSGEREEFAVPGTRQIAESGLLYCPERNSREYRARILVRSEPGQADTYVAETLWGPTGLVSKHSKEVYSGPDVHAAVRAANEMLEKKLKRQYTLKNPADRALFNPSSIVSGTKAP